MRVPRVTGELTIDQILRWADAHHKRTGAWPISRSGPAGGSAGRTWEGIDTSLRKGGNGLPGGSSLSRLLRQRRGVADARQAMPELSQSDILRWIDAHHARTGKYPGRESGRVSVQFDITWATIDRRLRQGGARMPGRSSLSELIRRERGVWDARGNHPLSPKLILQWADEHKRRTGRWPVTLSGPVLGHEPETWAAVDVAMRNGRRGYRGPGSLSRLLAQQRGYTPNYRPRAKSKLKPKSKPKSKPAPRKAASKRRPTRRGGGGPGPGVDWRAIQSLLRKRRR